MILMVTLAIMHANSVLYQGLVGGFGTCKDKPCFHLFIRSVEKETLLHRGGDNETRDRVKEAIVFDT